MGPAAPGSRAPRPPPAGLSEAAPPTRHNLHWGQWRGPTGPTASGCGCREGHRPLGGGSERDGAWRRARALLLSAELCPWGRGVGRGPADINIPGGQARPVICPDLEHDVRSQGTGARPAPTVSPTGEALGVGVHLGAGWPSGLGAPTPVEWGAAPALPTLRGMDSSGGALGKATLASTTTLPPPGHQTTPGPDGRAGRPPKVRSQAKSGQASPPTQDAQVPALGPHRPWQPGVSDIPGPRCAQETAGGGRGPAPSSRSSLTL